MALSILLAMLIVFLYMTAFFVISFAPRGRSLATGFFSEGPED